MRAIVSGLLAAFAAACGSEAPSAEYDAVAFAEGDGPASAQTRLADAGRPAASSERKGAVRRFQRGVIVDASGFAEPMAAATLFVPFDWTTSGGVLWGSEHLCTNGYNFNWSAVSPDGSEGVAVLPQARWENNSMGGPASTPGCSILPFSSVRDYLAALVNQVRPGARILEIRNRPDIVAEVGGAATRTPMPLGEARTWTESAEAVVAYSENGRDMRALVAAAVAFSSMTTDMSSVGGGATTSLTAYAHPAWAAFAPADRFNPSFSEAMRRSIVTNPQWASRISGHNLTIARDALIDGRKRADMIRQSNEEIARIREETWSAMQKSADYRAREMGELLRGVETYTDPDAPGGTTELSSSYDHAWRLKDGSYVMTNDASFDPWRDLNLEGEKLKPVK